MSAFEALLFEHLLVAADFFIAGGGRL